MPGTDTSIWNQENDVPENVITYVDENVVAKLPAGSRVRGIYPHGASYWTRTAEIQTAQPDGSTLSFFLKVAQKPPGKGMMAGEFASMTALHDAHPELVPKPIGWGTYKSDPDTHFFACAFHDMTDDIPNIEPFVSKVAELHTRAVSPTGKYGFHTQNCQGRIAQVVGFTDTWEEYFHNSMLGMFAVEEESQGPDQELTQLKHSLFEKVIPRLLRPLETGGRSIQPRLVHGDLWDGNTSTDSLTDMPLIFDAASQYAHNEYELAPWKPVRHKMTKPYVRAYHKHFPISAPEEDHDDRLTLYAIRFNILSSTSYPGNLRFRDIMKEDMRYLVEKYPDGYEGWAKKRGEGPFPRGK